MNKKKVIFGVIGLIVIIGLLVWWAKINERQSKQEEKKNIPQIVVDTKPVNTDPVEIKNQTYTIDDREVELRDGQGESSVAEGSATIAKTTLLSGPAFADLNGDNIKDAVVILRDEPGGSGLFYHIAVVLSGAEKSQATNSIFLGDRIRIQSISIDSSVISVVILERKPNEPFSVVPSVVQTLTFKISDNSLVKVEN